MIEHGFQSVVLWTDALFFLLIAASVVGLIHAWRSPPLHASWQRVTRRPTGMAAILRDVTSRFNEIRTLRRRVADLEKAPMAAVGEEGAGR